MKLKDVIKSLEINKVGNYWLILLVMLPWAAYHYKWLGDNLPITMKGYVSILRLTTGNLVYLPPNKSKTTIIRVERCKIGNCWLNLL